MLDLRGGLVSPLISYDKHPPKCYGGPADGKDGPINGPRKIKVAVMKPYSAYVIEQQPHAGVAYEEHTYVRERVSEDSLDEGYFWEPPHDPAHEADPPGLAEFINGNITDSGADQSYHATEAIE